VMSVLTSPLDAADPLEAALNRAGAVFAQPGGRRSVVSFGSAGGELAVCVSHVGLVDRSAMDKLLLAAPATGLDVVIARLTGASLAVGGTIATGGSQWCRIAADRVLLLREAAADGPRARDQLRQHLLHHPSLTVEDRSGDWAAIGLIGRNAARVLKALGAYGEAGDPRLVAPVTPGRVGGAAVTWLHECDHSALAIVPRGEAGGVWQAIEAAGRPHGISCVGHQAATRFRLMERADEHRRRLV
jgi:glycine cleavage system aminomethyltransferase T